MPPNGLFFRRDGRPEVLSVEAVGGRIRGVESLLGLNGPAVWADALCLNSGERVRLRLEDLDRDWDLNPRISPVWAAPGSIWTVYPYSGEATGLVSLVVINQIEGRVLFRMLTQDDPPGTFEMPFESLVADFYLRFSEHTVAPQDEVALMQEHSIFTPDARFSKGPSAVRTEPKPASSVWDRLTRDED